MADTLTLFLFLQASRVKPKPQPGIARAGLPPKRKVNADGAAKVEPKRLLREAVDQASSGPLPRWTRSQKKKKKKKPRGKDKAADKKVQLKGKRGAKGKQAEEADQQTTDLPAENGETENQSPASEEEKEAKSD
uniref:non-histone chromosomal protein HMG-14-like n=1 Tax=Arvicanthis niloticus TaxID=61156 RepID=UPI001486111D|nr:non-histone chromosomal protein HMG-14-like [Arvicanthis niloticus]